MAKKKAHGGKRKGAGRKPVPPSERAIPVAITVPRPLLNELDAMKMATARTRSDLITEAIRQFVAKQ
jgi:hypothetical protein